MSKQKAKPIAPKPQASVVKPAAIPKTIKPHIEIPPIPYNQRNYWILCGLLVVSCVVIYLPGFWNDFVWDDHFYIVNNRYIHDISWENLKEVLTGYMLGNYHPLTVFSNYIEYSLVGSRAWVFHLDNLIIHIVNSWLVFKLIYRLYPNFLIAAVTSVLFAIHPLHVESVVWAAERKDVLYTLFLLISFRYYLRYWEEEKSRKLYLLSFLFFVLSCLSKGMAVVLPLVLLLTDFLFLKRKLDVKLILEKVPFFLIALGTGILSILAQRSAGADASSVLAMAYSTVERFFFICYGLAYYWVKMIFPVNLYAFYPYPQLTGLRKLPAEYYMFFFALLAIVLTIYVLGRKDARIWWGGLFFFVVILPVAQILPVGSAMMADRYFYVSSIGPLFLLGVFANYLYQKGGLVNKILPFLGGIMLLTYGGLALQRAMIWKDPFTLFSDVLKKYPEDPMVMSNIGWWYYAKSDTANAIMYFEKTHEKNLRTADIHYALGQMYFEKKDYAKTLYNFEEAIKLKPQDMRNLYWMLGTACYYANDYTKAILYSEKAIEVMKDNANAWNILGLANTRLKEFDKAEGYYKKAMAIDNKFYDPYVNMGHLYNQKGDHEKEIEFLGKAIKMDPKGTLAYKNMGVAYVALGQDENAIKYWKLGSKADPKDGSFDYNIGLRYATKGNIPEAIVWYKQAAKKGDQTAVQLLNARGIAF